MARAIITCDSTGTGCTERAVVELRGVPGEDGADAKKLVAELAVAAVLGLGWQVRGGMYVCPKCDRRSQSAAGEIVVAASSCVDNGSGICTACPTTHHIPPAAVATIEHDATGWKPK